jgi:transposase-like protein
MAVGLAGVRALPRVPVELRKIVYTTNAIESLNARFRRAVRHRGHFPTEQAALKVLYLVAT